MAEKLYLCALKPANFGSRQWARGRHLGSEGASPLARQIRHFKIGGRERRPSLAAFCRYVHLLGERGAVVARSHGITAIRPSRRFAGAPTKCVFRAVKPISRAQWNDGFRPDS